MERRRIHVRTPCTIDFSIYFNPNQEVIIPKNVPLGFIETKSSDEAIVAVQDSKEGISRHFSAPPSSRITSLKNKQELRRMSLLQEDEFSYRNVLTSKTKLRYFKKYARLEHSAENILFYEKIIKFRQLPESKRLRYAELILKEFFNDKSPLALNISKKMELNIRKKIAQQKLDNICDVSVFDDCLRELLSGVVCDTFMRFTKSRLFKEMKEACRKRKL